MKKDFNVQTHHLANKEPEFGFKDTMLQKDNKEYYFDHYPEQVQKALKILIENDTGRSLIDERLEQVNIELAPIRISEPSYYDAKNKTIFLCKHETPIYMAMDIVHFLSLVGKKSHLLNVSSNKKK